MWGLCVALQPVPCRVKVGIQHLHPPAGVWGGGPRPSTLHITPPPPKGVGHISLRTFGAAVNRVVGVADCPLHLPLFPVIFVFFVGPHGAFLPSRIFETGLPSPQCAMHRARVPPQGCYQLFHIHLGGFVGGLGLSWAGRGFLWLRGGLFCPPVVWFLWFGVVLLVLRVL